MGLFSNYYTRPGPGIPKDAPKKKGAALFFEILWREFFELVKLNLLFVLACLPVVTIPAAVTAMSRITVTMVRDQNHFLWSDFWRVFRAEFWRSLLAGALLAGGLALAALGIRFYGAGLESSAAFYLPLGICLLTAMLLTMAGYYLFPMLAAIDQPLSQVLRNALLLSMICLPHNLIVLAVHLAAWALLLFLPGGLLAVPLFFFAPLNLLSTFCAWSGLCRYVIRDPS